MSILDELRELHAKASAGDFSGIDIRTGICGQLSTDINTDYYKSWPLFSGLESFPVFDSSDVIFDRPVDQYHYIGSLWQGRQLELRLSLLEHLIKCYESDEIV